MPCSLQVAYLFEISALASTSLSSDIDDLLFALLLLLSLYSIILAGSFMLKLTPP